MDEILASIRRIIEGGDERVSERLDPVVHAQMLQISEVDGLRVEEDLDLKARAFSEGSSANQAGLPVWPEGPGEPANDRTAMVAHLKRETKALTPDSDRDHETPSAEFRGPSEEGIHSVAVDSVGLADAGPSPAAEVVAASGARIGGDVLAEVSPAIQAARQSAQSLAARTERLIAVVAGLPAEPVVFDDIKVQDSAGAALSLLPDLDDALNLTTAISGPSDGQGKTSDALQDSLRSLRADAFGEAASAGLATQFPDADALDAFAEFDEDEFANELLDRSAMLDADASSTDACPVEVMASLSDKTTPEDQRRDGDAHIARDSAAAPAASVWSGADLPPRMDAAIHQLISEEASQRVSASFTDLSIAIRDGQMQSIDDTVQVMLRPMLQEWLDDNLPHMVERLVREEIERVARGGRR